MSEIYYMRFPPHCPMCNYRPYPYPKPTVINYHKENQEMVVRIEYPCGQEVTFRRPYQTSISKRGHVYVNTPNGAIAEHRFLWEQAHGKLSPGFLIHHINGDLGDNRIDNLIAIRRVEHNTHISKKPCRHT